MGRKLNLSHLSEGECRQILDVIQRDFSIRQKEKERLVKLQKLVKDEEQKRLVLSRQKQFNEKYCICCFSSFGLIFNKRTECKSCGFFICRDCSVKPEGVKVLMCLGCAQQRELQVQVCEWFYGQIRNRFRRFGSAKVVRSLYKRDSLSSESFDHCSNDSGVDHQLSPPAKGLLSPEEASRVFMETLEKQTGTASKEVFGVPYKALLDNPDWLPLFRPQTSSVAVQAPEDVLSDVLDSRQALEDFVFNLPPEEEELVAAVEAQITALQRSREQSTMDIAGYQADGKFATVSVAMCNLTSPEGYVPFTYGPAIQIQIPRERVDSPVDFTMDVPMTPEQSSECNNNENHEEVVQDEVELEMGIIDDDGDINGGQREPFSISKCEVSVALRPSNAVIVRYLQEGDDATVWPDFRFNQKKLKLTSEADDGNDFNSENSERHITTLHMSIGSTTDNLPFSVTDGEQTAEVSLPMNETEDRGVAGVV